MEWKHLPRKFREEIISKRQRIKVVVTFLLVVLLASTTGYIGWLIYFKPQPQVISGVSFYRKGLTVNVNGQTKRLDMFDTYHFNLDLAKEVTVSIQDDSGQTVETRTHQLGNQAGVVMDLWADTPDLNQCVISAEVTDKYYSLNQVQVPTSFTPKAEVRTLSAQPVNTFYTTLRIHENRYIFPDSYAGDTLPTNIDTFMEVYGFYFIPCADVEDRDKVAGWVDWWRIYNPESQRRLYQAELDRIAGSTQYK